MNNLAYYCENQCETFFNENVIIQYEINKNVADKYCKGCLVGEAYPLLKYESYGTFIDHNLYSN